MSETERIHLCQRVGAPIEQPAKFAVRLRTDPLMAKRVEVQLQRDKKDAARPRIAA